VQIAVAALAAGIAPLVQVPAGQLWLATRFLDGGGLGIVVPHVDTPDEARHIAKALRYPHAATARLRGACRISAMPNLGWPRLWPPSMLPHSSSPCWKPRP
jgi:2-keto-3-deoxy-L-rhamnonate aldolase RhmA